MTHPLNIDLDEFPIARKLTYMNHAGTAPITKSAAKSLKVYADEVSSFASSIYGNWTKRLNKTRAASAELLGCDVDEIAFVKSTTQGINLVALGIDWKPGDVVIAEERTFPANWIAWRDIAQSRGATLWAWPERDNHHYALEDLEARLRQGKVRLVASTTANFSTGFRQDIEAVGKLCRQYGALHCVDAIQTLGVVPIDVKAAHIDFLSADGHKWLLGPEGAGIFYCAKEHLETLDPKLTGWLGRDRATIEFDRLDLPPAPTSRRFEEGAPNVSGHIALGKSLRVILGAGVPNILRHNQSLGTRLAEGLAGIGWQVVTPLDPLHRASIIASHKPGLSSQAAVKHLWDKGQIWAACRRDFLRISPHFYQTTENIDHVIKTLSTFR